MSFITGYPQQVTLILFFLFSVPIVIFDIKSMRIPDILVYTGIACLFCYRFACTRAEFLVYVGAAVISVLLFIIVRISSKNGMGWGDVKYSALCGLYAGPAAVFVGYIIAAALCAVWYAIRKAQKKIDKNTKFPFAPFMAAGTLLIGIFPFVKLLV